MYWEELEMFLCVAELESFTRAAERLNRPKSSISRAVVALEERLGERLLDRSNRKVQLTDAGRSLFQESLPLVERLNGILSERQSQSAEVHGMLRIATTYEIATANLIDVLPEILTLHPKLKVTVDFSLRVVDPAQAGYDVVLYHSLMPLPDSPVIARRLYEVAFGIYASPSMVRELGFPETPADLDRWPAITATADQEYCFTRAETKETITFRPNSRLVVPSAVIRARSAEMGVGVAVLPLLFCRELIEQRRLVRVLPAYELVPLTVYALLPSRKIVPARLTALLDTISNRFDSRTTVR